MNMWQFFQWAIEHGGAGTFWAFLLSVLLVCCFFEAVITLVKGGK